MDDTHTIQVSPNPKHHSSISESREPDMWRRRLQKGERGYQRPGKPPVPDPLTRWVHGDVTLIGERQKVRELRIWLG
ncbi:hypothetical protein AVEN_189528-1 [Araneus ventricosus]|uniref:Uncharacterized protein n=1 Tax=Araneus ventricosus TaxID=182803 RepID=A0A4Y2GLN5_ARAVE|nr:hypothetical protein AVEN_189528-1 [Araneus ventricosus]